MTRLLAAILALATFAAQASAAPVDTGHLVAELGAQSSSLAPGRTVYVALRQKIDKGWHTYWRNPGDSGEATQIRWNLPPGWKAGEIVWAPPLRLPVGPLMNYGYAGEVTLPVPITAPADAQLGDRVALKAEATFLVCEDICVPEEAALDIALQVAAAPADPDPRWGPLIAKALAASPKPSGFSAAFGARPAGIALAVTGRRLSGVDVSSAYFFPYDGTVIDHAKPQPIERGRGGLTLTLTPGPALKGDAPPKAIAGVLSLGSEAFEITARAAQGALPEAASGLGPPPAKAAVAGGRLGLALAMVFAFLGGLILNLMPCVFPVLAMKAASLAGHAHEPAEARRQGLAFGAGVVATFLALASALIASHAAGAVIGWGFQLQSPVVVAGLALLMLAVALNLSGLFEVGASLQGLGAGAASRGGLQGAFFTGALAVIVAAPCTAPFMAPALGWALTQTPASALAVFLALGLGFAAPFVAAAFAPTLLLRLPRPGPWMDLLRKGLAFPMYGTAAWLVWVLTIQAGPMALARLLAAGVVLALALWLLGIAQRRRLAGTRAGFLAGFAGLLAIASIAVGAWPDRPAASSPAGERGAEARVPHEIYSAQRLAALRAEGRPVFVNFTAAWCVTCQVNEKVALSQDAVAKAFARTGAVYLKADWTSKDPLIAAELARHGRAGVPLYLVYGAGGGEAVILPQFLSPNLVVRALERAAGGVSARAPGV